VHLEIDTGMSRQGTAPAGLAALLPRFSPASPLRLEGVATHLFAPEETDGRVTSSQMARLEHAIQQIQSAGHQPEWLSVGSSASLLSGQTTAISALAARFGMKAILRPGLALYGIPPQFEPDEPPAAAKSRANLKPVLSWKTQVVSVRNVEAGAVVGYNGTFVAVEPMQLALLAAGYADGLVRKLGNNFSLLVKGERAPLVGRISMDQAVIDVTGIANVAPGDEVVIIGSQGAEAITADDHAAATGTISWEVFTRIGARVRRLAV
jgi:alanine racemase